MPHPESTLPPCGLYRTLGPIGPIPEGRLVYFHNHGTPGPGLYLPERWKHNRAQLKTQGTLLPSLEDVRLLLPLPPEGFYRITETFYCCEQRCRRFDADMLVQLGFDEAGEALLFVPELVDGMIAIPERGSRVILEKLKHTQLLKIAETKRISDTLQ